MALTYSGKFMDTEAGPMPLPPTDLPSHEPPLETYLHLQQMLLLLKCLDWLWQDRTDYFAAGNLTIYYSIPNEQGHLWSEELSLFLGIYEDKLRFFDPEGEMVPTPEESARQEASRADRLAAKLRELGVDPDDLE